MEKRTCTLDYTTNRIFKDIWKKNPSAERAAALEGVKAVFVFSVLPTPASWPGAAQANSPGWGWGGGRLRFPKTWRGRGRGGGGALLAESRTARGQFVFVLWLLALFG